MFAATVLTQSFLSFQTSTSVRGRDDTSTVRSYARIPQEAIAAAATEATSFRKTGEPVAGNARLRHPQVAIGRRLRTGISLGLRRACISIESQLIGRCLTFLTNTAPRRSSTPSSVVPQRSCAALCAVFAHERARRQGGRNCLRLLHPRKITATTLH